MSNEFDNLDIAKTVDARGTACPGPLLEAKRSMASVPMSGVMEVLSSDKATTEDIQLWSKKVGHDFIGFKEDSGYWRIYVRRGK